MALLNLSDTVIGLFVPVPFYIGHRYFPKLRLNRLVTPQLCNCLGYLSASDYPSRFPGRLILRQRLTQLASFECAQVLINSSIMSLFLLAIWSQIYLRKRHPTFFRKYNYLLAASLDGGTDFMVFISTLLAMNGGAGKQYTFPTWALNPQGHYDCGPPKR
ncbi:BQ2448_2404 [Microbotryum intermedium]|uniref:BQ2448_2404 protein n=1 Tax=Microbotryum intermedium TaxID=269621 RepID=A0A238FBV6_9BASI|nr:BQ2448_2404 [Microbotryum intermedium]